MAVIKAALHSDHYITIQLANTFYKYNEYSREVAGWQATPAS